MESIYEGLYIKNNIWREMYDFSPDAVLMVLASDYYKEEDYIRNYEEFLKSNEMKWKKGMIHNGSDKNIPAIMYHIFGR